MFRPKSSICLTCGWYIQVDKERSYVVWDALVQRFRRMCDFCWDHGKVVANGYKPGYYAQKTRPMRETGRKEEGNKFRVGNLYIFHRPKAA